MEKRLGKKVYRKMPTMQVMICYILWNYQFVYYIID